MNENGNLSAHDELDRLARVQARPGLESVSDKPGQARTPSFAAIVAPLENGECLDGPGLEVCLAEFEKNPEGFQLAVENIRSKGNVRRPLGVLIWRIKNGKVPRPTNAKPGAECGMGAGEHVDGCDLRSGSRNRAETAE